MFNLRCNSASIGNINNLATERCFSKIYYLFYNKSISLCRSRTLSQITSAIGDKVITNSYI